MTDLDWTPLFRSAVGFDRLAALLDELPTWDEPDDGYPPYNIEKPGEDRYRITVAVAGFGEDELDIRVEQNRLVVTGARREADGGATPLYRGIPARPFRRTFRLADHVQVLGATLDGGLLHVDLLHEVPEEKKPRRIEIAAPDKPRQIASSGRKSKPTATAA